MKATTTNSRSIQPSRAAFTLVDLLAILGVLAIGLALLTPALAHTRPNSTAFQCFNNLRQLGRAWLMYADDNKETVTYPNWGSSVPGWLYRPVGGSPPNLSAPPYNANPIPAYESGQCWNYIKNMGTYRCPLDKTPTPTFSQRANKMSTYVMNGALCGYGTLAASIYKLTAFRSDDFLMWEPDSTTPYSYNDASSYPALPETIDRRHGKIGGIVLTVGGSVEFVKYADWTTLSADPKKNRLWCNPGTANGR